MHKQELVALCALFIILVGFPVSVFAYQYVYLPATPDEAQIIDLVAQAPEAGGWNLDHITVNKGDTVRLRITSQDVVHGFVIGKLGVDTGPILPGEPVTVEFVADEAGQFTYYCNVWCSPYHYRMRGTLEVIDPAAPDAPPMAEEEPDVGTDIDVDSPHEAEFYPASRPSAVRGQALADQIEIPTPLDLRQQSPSAVFQAIRERNPTASDDEIWDLIAHLWFTTTTPEQLAVGQALYTKNCAACHGETGGGDGPGDRYVEEQAADFTNAGTMAGGSSAIYYVKIRRGGMGTGMPYWGTIFTEEETWNIVDYLWTFVFTDTKDE
ncbi:MAG: c-type cytochrome [Anaerolineae bacterium]